MSSRLSSIDYGRRRAACIAPEAVTVYHWEGGGITDTFVFDADDAGLALFDRYLRESDKGPLYMLVDVVEEEYRHETIPHLYGADRRAVLERKLAWFFRGTPYTHVLPEGRETEGRRDDKVLLSAITNPELVQPWTRLCVQQKVPVAGIYSLAIVSTALLDRINVKSPNVLMVSMQSHSGLRQSYFRDRVIKISRLAKMPRLGTVPFAPYILNELDKFERYLKNVQLLAEGPLDIYILAHGELLDPLERQCRNSETVRYHLLDVADVARRLGIQGVLTTPFSDYIYAHLLLKKRPRNHYGQAEDLKYYRLHQARSGMLLASAAILLLAAVGGGLNLVEGLSLRQRAASAEQRAGIYQAQFNAAKGRLPETPVDPQDIKTAVDIADTLSRYKATPLEMMRAVSRALDGYPELQIASLDWLAGTDPNAVVEGEPRGDEDMPPPGSTPPGDSGDLYYQIAVLTGEIRPFDGDFRAALDRINGFAAALRARPAVRGVTVLNVPFDVDPAGELQGGADDAARPEKAEFTVKVVLGVGRAAG